MQANQSVWRTLCRMYSNNVMYLFVAKYNYKRTYSWIKKKSIKNMLHLSFTHFTSQLWVFMTGSGGACTTFFHRGLQDQQKTKFLVAAVTATLRHKQTKLDLLMAPRCLKQHFSLKPLRGFNCSWLLVYTFSHRKVNYKTVELFWHKTYWWLPILDIFMHHLSLGLRCWFLTPCLA